MMRMLVLMAATLWLFAFPAAAGSAESAEEWPAPASGPDRVEPGSTEAIRGFTTEPRHLPPQVAYVPRAEGVPSPAQVLGHLPGARGQLARSAELSGYLDELAGASDRVQTFRIGRTEEGRSIRIAVVGSAAHLDRLTSIRNTLTALADPRETGRDAARALVDRVPVVVALSAGLTAGDLAGPEMLVELAHRLAVSETEAVQLIREQVLVVILPVADPDARDKSVDWFRRHLTGRTSLVDLPPAEPPYWGTHVREDGAKDVLLATTGVARAFLDVFFRFRPALVIDIGAASLAPMGRNPVDPGAVDAVRIESRVGPGPAWFAATHNSAGRRLETLATGTAETLPVSAGSDNAADGTTWSLRNSVNLAQSAALKELAAAAGARESLLLDGWRRADRTVRRGRRISPHAWMIPPATDDPWRRALLVSVLIEQGIEVDELTAPWRDGRTLYAAGAFVVRADQPYGGLARSLLSAARPDDTFVSLPGGGRLDRLLGVDVVASSAPDVADAPTEPVLGFDIPFSGRLVGGESPFYVVPDRGQVGFYELMTRLRTKSEMSVALRFFDIPAPTGEGENGRVSCPPGSLVVAPAGAHPADLHYIFQYHASGLGLTAYGVSEVPEVPSLPVSVPRLAIYESWAATRSSGWYRYAFSRSRLVYQTLHDAEIRAGSLRESHDVILVPDIPGAFRDLVHGLDERHGNLAFTESPEYPSHGSPFGADKLTGGMGLAGLENLFRFVRDGGVLIALENAGTLVVDGGLVRGLRRIQGGEMAAGEEIPARFLTPDHPIAFGHAETTSVLRSSAPLWEVGPGGGGRVILEYADTAGKSDLAGRAAIIDVPVGRGRVILFTFDPMDRYLNHSDFRLLHNAILHGPTLAATQDETAPASAEGSRRYGRVTGFSAASRRGHDVVNHPEPALERP